jgi:tripartite-type tricarboxylate transporter receptor subunit TctC
MPFRVFQASAISFRGTRQAPGSAWRRRRSNEIIESLNHEINAGLADPMIEARLADMGGMLLTGSPEDFGKLIASETEKWSKVIRTAGIKAE